VQAFKERAGSNGRGVVAEDRDISAAKLTRPRTRGFAEILASMPDAGVDADFARVESEREETSTFD
jgi:plasmid stability protein